MDEPAAPPPTLTPREKQCLRYLAMGWHIRAIAAELGTGIKTVDKQLASARARLGANTTEHAIAIAIRHHLF